MPEDQDKLKNKPGKILANRKDMALGSNILFGMFITNSGCFLPPQRTEETLGSTCQLWKQTRIFHNLFLAVSKTCNSEHVLHCLIAK